MAKGWISLHRNIKDHYLFKEKRVFSRFEAWIDILLSANHVDGKAMLFGSVIDVKAGELITSEIKLMDKWGWSKTKVRRFLNELVCDGMVIRKSDNKKTTLTVVKWAQYQHLETTEEPQKDFKKTSKRLQKDTFNNDNKINNENNNIIPNGICQNENFDKAHKGEKIDFTLLLEFYNKTFGKQARIVNDKVKRAYNARMKEGYLKEDIQKAMQVCKLNDFHKSNNFQYCTLEFFSRSDTLDKYATVGDKSQKPVYSPR